MTVAVTATVTVAVTLSLGAHDIANGPEAGRELIYSALEAGIGAFPRRLMVDRARWLAAKTILTDAGEFYDD